MKSSWESKEIETGTWDLWQVETALACNLKCVMCPWHGFRGELPDQGLMEPAVWKVLAPFLDRVKSVDFTGGGEPLLNSNLLDWIRQAKLRGCETGFLTNGLLLQPSLSQEILSIGIDWLAVSIDGADKAVYERLRRGSDFAALCRNVETFARLRSSNKPLLMVNFVIMRDNIDQLEEMVRLASNLGVNRVVFKQCDIVRQSHGRGLGLYTPVDNRETRRHQKLLNRAQRLAAKLKLETSVYSFIPNEEPVCNQNPCQSMFIGYDGSAAPCINLARGGAAEFMGNKVDFPTVRYGNVLETDIVELWQGGICRNYRRIFQERMRIHDKVLADSDFGSSLLSLRRAFQDAVVAMPEAPPGCGVCHYLYGV
ncbi:MAG: radical SAM protein [Proteobacteria bacterium]|nr:radical SAM protein [Pseudomonadota bacterium]